MSIEHKQLGMIHQMAHKAGIETRKGKDRTDYELILVNAGGVRTSKDLDQLAYEDVMAILEDLAEACGQVVGHYWRDVTAGRGDRSTSRMRWKIVGLHQAYEDMRGDNDPHYELAGLAERASHGRTADVAQLNRKEAWGLIEALKAIYERSSRAEDLAAVAHEPAPF